MTVELAGDRRLGTTIDCCGLDGANPLAMLAALGALELLARTPELEPRLSWARDGPAWHARITGRFADESELVDRLAEAAVSRDLSAELGWARDIMKVERVAARRHLADPDSATARIVAACLAELPLRDNNYVPYTPLRVIPRVGRAKFVEALRKTAQVEHAEAQELLGNTLFEVWEYTDKVNPLRWDPVSGVQDRAYAARHPSHSGTLGNHGSMVLASAGLSFLTMHWTSRSALPVGMADRSTLVWPLWTAPLAIGPVRSLLRTRWLFDARPDPRKLVRHGIAARMVASLGQSTGDATYLSWGEQRDLPGR